MPAEYQPDYQRIAADVASKIQSGEWKPGDQLPTKRDLAIMYGTSVGPVEAAMILLRAQRLVEGRQGKGVYVAAADPSTGA